MPAPEFVFAPPTNAAGEIDYAQSPALDRYREGDQKKGLDESTIAQAVESVNDSAATAKITKFHGALAVREVAKKYIEVFGASPSTVNRPPEPERSADPPRTRERGRLRGLLQSMIKKRVSVAG